MNNLRLFQHCRDWGLFFGIVFVIMLLSPVNADHSKWVKPHKAVTQQQIDQLPFYPSRATTAGKTLEPKMFEKSIVCKGCHEKIYQQWKRSVMAYSWKDPIYQALFLRASKATNHQVDNFCIGCHSPIGMTSMNASSTMIEDNIDLPGVNCESCHNITDINGNDNAAYVLNPNTDKHIKLGPHKDASSPYHKTAYSALHTQSEFCSTCHNVTHPFNGTPIERTYDEWKESAYNEEGVQCQDCHMTPGPGISINPGKSADMGKERKHIASHDFIGGNSTLLQYFGEKESAEQSDKMLQSAATIEFINLPESLIAGQLATIQVKVSNVGAGHKLPTGFPEGREIWIDFTVTSQSDEQIYRSGAVVDGHTEKGTKNFKVTLGDKNGDVVDLNVWEVDRVLSDTRIPPKGYSVVEYTFLIPETATGTLTINANLNYWPFSQKLIDELLGEDKLDVVIVIMTSAEQTLFIGNTALAKETTPSLDTVNVSSNEEIKVRH